MLNFNYSDLEREVNDEDFNHLVDLDDRRQVSASLGLATDGNKKRSPRYLSAHAPAGVGDELRILARSGDSTWGAACLTRGGDLPDFTAEEVRYAGLIARDVGFALRSDLLRVAAGRDSMSSDRAGTIVLDADDTIEGFTPEASHWMRRLGMAADVTQLPTAMRWVALQARAHDRAQHASGRLRPARSRIPTAGGDFVVVKAEPLHGSTTSKVVMTFEPADRATLLTLLMALHDLTPRENIVAGLLVGGWALPDIAGQMMVSLHTVRDHVKAIYSKTGVRSRPELTARLGGSNQLKSRSTA